MKQPKIQNYIAACLGVMLSIGTVKDATAQNTIPEKKWNFLTELYMLLPNMSGDVGVGNTLTVPVDANTGNIFSNLKLGGMIYLEAKTSRWAITSDFVFMNLEKDISPTALIRSGAVGMDQYIWEAAGLYRLMPFWEAGIGGRLNYLSADIDGERNTLPNGTEEFSGQQSKTFYDPVIITRLSTDINAKWLFLFRGDVGGFGVGSDFTWQLQAYAGYRFSKLFQITAGYRILGIDYDNGVDKERFIFNMNEFGPVVRLGFNF